MDNRRNVGTLLLGSSLEGAHVPIRRKLDPAAAPALLSALTHDGPAPQDNGSPPLSHILLCHCPSVCFLHSPALEHQTWSPPSVPPQPLPACPQPPAFPENSPVKFLADLQVCQTGPSQFVAQEHAAGGPLALALTSMTGKPSHLTFKKLKDHMVETQIYGGVCIFFLGNAM